MLTKDQASVIADQLTQEAKSRNERQSLKRLEARAGSMPAGLSIEQFGDLIARAESQVYRSWPLMLTAAAWIGLLLIEYYFKTWPLIVGTIPLAFLSIRLLARRLIRRYILGLIQPAA